MNRLFWLALWLVNIVAWLITDKVEFCIATWACLILSEVAALRGKVKR